MYDYFKSTLQATKNTYQSSLYFFVKLRSKSWEGQVESQG